MLIMCGVCVCMYNRPHQAAFLGTVTLCMLWTAGNQAWRTFSVCGRLT